MLRVILALFILLAIGLFLRTCACLALRFVSSRFNLKVTSVAWFAAGKGLLCLSEVELGTPLTENILITDRFHLRIASVTAYVRRPDPGSKHKWVTLQVDGTQVYVHPPRPKRSEGPPLKTEGKTNESDSSNRTLSGIPATANSKGQAAMVTEQIVESGVPPSSERKESSAAPDETRSTPNKYTWMQECQRLFRRLLLRCLETAIFMVVSFVDVNVVDSELHAGIASIFLGRLTVHLKYADSARRDAVEAKTPAPPRSLSTPDLLSSRHERSTARKRPSRLALEIGLEEMTVRAPPPADRNSGVEQIDEASNDGDEYPLTAFELCGAAVLTLSCRADYGYRKLNDFCFDLVVDPISLYLHNLLKIGTRLAEISSARRAQNPVTEPGNLQRLHRLSVSTNAYLSSSDGLVRETPPAGVNIDLRTLPRTTNIDIKSVTLHYTPVIQNVSAQQGDGDSVPTNDCEAAAIAAADVSMKLYLQPTSQKNQCQNCLPEALQSATFRISRVVGDFYGHEPLNWSMHALEVGTIYLHVEGGHQIEGSLEVNTPSIRIDVNYVEPISTFLDELTKTIRTVQPSGPNPKKTEERCLNEFQSQLLPRKAPTRRKINSGRRESLIPMKELSGGLLCRLSPSLLLLLESSPPIIFHLKVVEFVLSIGSDTGETSTALALTSGCHELVLRAQYGEVVPTVVVEEGTSKNQTDYFSSSRLANASSTGEVNGNGGNMKHGAWGLMRAILRSDTLYIGMHRGKTTKTRPNKSTNLFTNDISTVSITAQLIRKRASPLLPSPLDRPDSFLDDENFPEDPTYSDLIIKLQLGNSDIWLFEEQTELLNTILFAIMESMPKNTNLEKISVLRSSDFPRPMKFPNANLLLEARQVQLHCAGHVSPEDSEPRGLLFGIRCMRVMHLPFISANRLPGSRPPNGDVWSDRSQLDIRLDDIDVSVLVCNSTQRELATGADSYSAGANLIKIPSVDVTTTIAASDDAEFVSEVTITVKIPEIDLQFSSLHLYSAFAILILVRQLLDFPRQAQQAPPAKWHVRRASHAYRRFSTAVPGPASAQKRASPSQTHLAIQVWVTINRFDVIWTLPDGPRVFWEIDKIHGRGTLPEGEFGGSIKAFRIMGIKPDSTATKSELVRLIGISILVDNKINKTDDPEVNIRSQDSPHADRKEGKESEKRSNKEISVMIEIVESRIPYKYVVADVFDAANNLVKLGKRLALELIPATGELPPPHKERDPIPTIIVAIDAIHCRIDDDPFEIALARTYTAGFEEQKARLAREQAFHHKLSTINQGHGGEASQSPGHHGAGYDLQSAWQSLQEYNSRNWIRRIKEYTALQSSQNAPHNYPPTDTAFGMQGEFRNVRSNSTFGFHSSEAMNASSSSLQSVAPSVRPIPLFRVSIFHLQITLRDPGFGRLEAPKRISQLDGGQSSVTQKYDLLFCSDVELGLSEATVRVRNHPLPLVYVPPSRQNMPTLPAESPSTGSTSSVDARQPDSSLVLKGLLILAEPFPAPESIYKPFVPIASIPSEQMDCINRSEQGFGLFVERTVAPIKIFYDIDVKIQSETPTLATFGAHILPSVQDISRVMDTLTKPNLDPSPALGFWDKIRLLLHGRIGIEFVGPPTREVIVQDAQCAEKRREESTAGGFRFLLSGSRDPFYSKNKSAGSAGYEAVWSGGTKMELGGTGTELVSIVADQFIFGIPKGEPDDVSQEPSVDASVGETDGFAKPSRPVAGPGFEKVVVKFSGGIRLAVGALFENENAGTRCQNRPSRAICPHSQVAMRSPENVQQGSKYDSFKSFRSVAIHAIVTLTCPTSQSAAANPYNSIHITPITLIHFENWISLFASNMTLPVRSGCVFPDSQSVPNKKLGRFLHTVRARANISPLFITYMHSGKQSVVGGADVGLKGRLERFALDLMCEQTMENESSPCPPIWTVAECQLDVTKLDIRAVSYDVTGSASMHPPVGESESQREINCGVKQDSTIGGEDGEWADADDYTEIGKIDEEDRITRGILSGTPIIKPFIFSPRLVYFMQSKHPLEESDDLHVGEKGDEGSSEIIREGRDTHKVQSDLLQRRLREIDQDIERQAIKLKEMESKITQFSADEEMLKEVCA